MFCGFNVGHKSVCCTQHWEQSQWEGDLKGSCCCCKKRDLIKRRSEHPLSLSWTCAHSFALLLSTMGRCNSRRTSPDWRLPMRNESLSFSLHTPLPSHLQSAGDRCKVAVGYEKSTFQRRLKEHILSHIFSTLYFLPPPSSCKLWPFPWSWKLWLDEVWWRRIHTSSNMRTYKAIELIHRCPL